MTASHDNHDEYLNEPGERLGRELRGLYAPPVEVPTEIDEAVTALARRHFARRHRMRLLLRRSAFAAAAAAAIALTIVHIYPIHPESTGPARVVQAATPEDIDGNGRVDIRDAFLLARRLESDQQPVSQWDLNGDGVIDRHDVDLVATAAVKLDKGA